MMVSTVWKYLLPSFGQLVLVLQGYNQYPVCGHLFPISLSSVAHFQCNSTAGLPVI